MEERKPGAKGHKVLLLKAYVFVFYLNLYFNRYFWLHNCYFVKSHFQRYSLCIFFVCHTITVPWTTVVITSVEQKSFDLSIIHKVKKIFFIYGNKVTWQKTTCKPFLHGSSLQGRALFKSLFQSDWGKDCIYLAAESNSK